jgi:hypothetical protein
MPEQIDPFSEQAFWEYFEKLGKFGCPQNATKFQIWQECARRADPLKSELVSCRASIALKTTYIKDLEGKNDRLEADKKWLLELSKCLQKRLSVDECLSANREARAELQLK